MKDKETVNTIINAQLNDSIYPMLILIRKDIHSHILHKNMRGLQAFNNAGLQIYNDIVFKIK